MDILNTIVSSLNKEEQRGFKLFINRTRSLQERKDEQLFNYIRKNHLNYDEEDIQRTLYGQDDKNSFYRLKNRLLEDLGKSLTLHHFNEVEYNTAVYNIALSKLYSGKNQAKVAFYFLNKAQKISLKNEYYDLLDLIYGEFIKLSHETLEINPEEFIEKRKHNREHINKIQQIDDIMAALAYRIKTTQLLSGKGDTKILGVLEKTIQDFSKDPELRKSPAFRFKIYHVLSRILVQQEDYPSLEKYLVKTYDEFLKEKLFNRNSHDTKLQMLTYIINALCKNYKFTNSLEYAEKLKETMNEYEGFLYDKYLFFYYNSLIINYSELNLDKAIELLNEAKENSVIQKNPLHIAYIYPNLSQFYFNKKDYKAALKNLLKLIMGDSFSKLNEGFRLKVEIAQLIVRYELGDFDLLERIIKTTEKQYRKLKKQKEYGRDFDMVALIQYMAKYTDTPKQKTVKEKKNVFLKKYRNTSGNDVINYIKWLSS